jgi:glycosyltransferase involved in cell wall biosynthesis
MTPFFSICIPTRNRAEYLQHAIKSILSQTFNDFEIIISDNNSSDDTRRVVKSFKDARIRYYHSKKNLPLTDNWNKCYSMARGEYFMLIGDDDYLLPQALEAFSGAIRNTGADILYSRSGRYEYVNRFFAFSGNTTGKTYEVSKKEYLNDFFNFVLRIGNSTNCCISRKLASNVGNGEGFFKGPFPDYHSMTAAVIRCKKLLFIDRNLSILGVTSKSNGPALMDYRLRRTDLTDDFGSGYETPLKSKIMSNGMYITFALLLSEYQKELEAYRINMRKYYTDSGNYLFLNVISSFLSFKPGFISECSVEFIEFLVKAPKRILLLWVLRLPVSLAVSYIPYPALNSVRNAAVGIAPLRWLVGVLGFNSPGKPKVISVRFSGDTTIDKVAKRIAEGERF